MWIHALSTEDLLTIPGKSSTQFLTKTMRNKFVRGAHYHWSSLLTLLCKSEIRVTATIDVKSLNAVRMIETYSIIRGQRWQGSFTRNKMITFTQWRARNSNQQLIRATDYWLFHPPSKHIWKLIIANQEDHSIGLRWNCSDVYHRSNFSVHFLSLVQR